MGRSDGPGQGECQPVGAGQDQGCLQQERAHWLVGGYLLLHYLSGDLHGLKLFQYFI